MEDGFLEKCGLMGFISQVLYLIQKLRFRVYLYILAIFIGGLGNKVDMDQNWFATKAGAVMSSKSLPAAPTRF